MEKIILDIIDRHLNKNAIIKVLDIGCGSGLMLNALEDVEETFGMDMSDDAINFSKDIFSSGPWIFCRTLCMMEGRYDYCLSSTHTRENVSGWKWTHQ